MSRRKVIAKRTILPDPVYGSQLMSDFINRVMKQGKKSLAERIVYGALEQAAEMYNKRHKEKPKADAEGDSEGGDSSGSRGQKLAALDILHKAIDNLRPTVEVKSRRVGGATYQVPVEVRPLRGTSLAMRWLIEAAQQRGEKGMMARLMSEVLDVIEGRGSAIKKREEVHRMAKANQAFAHFHW